MPNPIQQLHIDNQTFELVDATARANAAAAMHVLQSAGMAGGIDYAMAISRPICIGDDLMAGATPLSPAGETDNVAENPAFYLGRMLRCDVENAAENDLTPAGFWAKRGNYVFSRYDAAVIWPGLCGGLAAMPTDAEIEAFVPSDTPTSDADGVLWLISIIKALRAATPGMLIALCTSYTLTGSAVQVTLHNAVLAAIAEKYDCVLIDLSDLSAAVHPELHAGLSDARLGKAGNITVAARVIAGIRKAIAALPTRAECGYTSRSFVPLYADEVKY